MAIQHDAVTSSDCHEPKHITGATTSDAGKVITPSSSTNGVSELRKIKASEIDTSADGSLFTYWALYADSTYTSGSPLAISSGVRTKLTIDGLGSSTDTAQLPAGVSLWNTSTNKITPEVENDMLCLKLTYTATATATSDTLTAELDIGGAPATVVEETKVLLKGASPTTIVHTWIEHAESAFITNGGELYLTPSANINVYDIELTIVRMHKGS